MERARRPRVMAFGAPGGDVIPQGMLQAFSNIVDFGLLPQQAVEAPRIAALSFPDYPKSMTKAGSASRRALGCRSARTCRDAVIE
jgi:gamma-glutamyltranspeptidase